MDAFKLTLLAAILIVLLVFFGDGGTDHLRVKTKEEKWQDRLDAASQRDPRLLGGGAGGPLSVTPQSTPNYYNPNYNPNVPQEGQDNIPANIPPDQRYRYLQTDPNRPPFPQQRPKWVTTPPEGTPAPSQMPQSRRDGFYLRSGEKVIFDGTRVYARDENGKVVPLPDGVYYSDDSRSTLRIVGGKQYVNY